MRQYPDVYHASVFLHAMKLKTGEQLAAEPGRWLTGLRERDVREECREQFEEWFYEEEWDEEQLQITLRMWRNVIGSSHREP
jgi:ferric-dicitrate binding protein FerR (iron transport regulator)